MNTLEMKNVSYRYSVSKANVLNHVNYAFESGRIYAIVGKSGARKTTLLSVLSSLATPTEGRILVGGKDISEIDKYEFRSSLVGVVFQSFNLLPHLTAVENVMLSMDIFRGLAGEGKCVIIVTHSPDVARAADVTYQLAKGT